MMFEGREIVTGWMNWNELKPFREQLVDLELKLMKDYHYPDWDISRSYPEERVAALETYLANGNTFFWGAIYDNTLIGYYWAYTAPFIDKKRWCLRSLLIREEFQGIGLGKLAVNEGLNKAVSLNCDEASVEYVTFNTAASRIYEQAGYEARRIEAVKTLK